MLKRIGDVHDAQVGRGCDAQLIVDTMNIIGSCVVAGGIRRSAQIAIGDADDQQFLQLKDASQKVSDYRWVANHSVLARPGMDYEEALRQSRANGEPGLFLGEPRPRIRPDDRSTESPRRGCSGDESMWRADGWSITLSMSLSPARATSASWVNAFIPARLWIEASPNPRIPLTTCL